MSQADTMAAATRNITTALVRAAAWKMSASWRKLSSRYTTMATNRAYTAATTAASVGVNTPMRRPTRMMTGKPRAHTDSRRALSTSARLARAGGATFSRRTSHHQVMASAMPSSTPGTMPARNSLLMDTLAATPKITKPMDGGMTGAMMPAEAISPAERALSCPAATIMGSSSDARAAASATAEPDTAARITAAMMAT